MKKSWLITTHPALETPKALFFDCCEEPSVLLRMEQMSRSLEDPLFLWCARAQTSVNKEVDVNVKDAK